MRRLLDLDKVQHFAVLSRTGMRQERTKYRRLVVANQYLERLDEHVLRALLGNDGTLAFWVGVPDADEFVPVFSIADLAKSTKPWGLPPHPTYPP